MASVPSDLVLFSFAALLAVLAIFLPRLRLGKTEIQAAPLRPAVRSIVVLAALGFMWPFVGRVFGMTSAVSPVGSVVALAGPGEVPHNWKVCDGSSVPYLGHEALWNALKDTPGNPSDDGAPLGATITLPDYRGVFLRGFDQTRRVDVGPRSPSNQVGSKQGDAVIGMVSRNGIGDATHVEDDQMATDMAPGMRVGGTIVDSSFSRKDEIDGAGSDRRAGAETRPVNIAVQWIIRIK